MYSERCLYVNTVFRMLPVLQIDMNYLSRYFEICHFMCVHNLKEQNFITDTSGMMCTGYNWQSPLSPSKVIIFSVSNNYFSVRRAGADFWIALQREKGFQQNSAF